MLCPNYFPYSIAEWTSMNTDFQQDDNHSLAHYCDRMKDATPHTCEYGTVIEAFTFSIIKQVNIVIYQALIDQTTSFYQKRAENFVSDNASTICILNTGNHYQSLFPMYDTDAAVFDADEYLDKSKIKTVRFSLSEDNSCVDSNFVFGSKNSSFSNDQNYEQNDEYKTNIDNHVSFMNQEEMKRIFLHLSSMEEKDLIQLYDTVKNKLVKRNGYVVDYNPALTAILGCHTNSLLLGSSEQAKAAAHYLGPYVDKDKTPLGETLEIIYEAMQYVKTHPSKADDAGTISRFAQFLLTRILDKLGSLIEYSDTQAAAGLIGLRTSISSEIFVGCDTDACINLVKNELFFNKETSRSCDSDDEEDCCSRPDEISDEESCLSDSFIEDDSKTWSKRMCWSLCFNCNY